MVNKLTLSSFISKYHLNGLHPTVKWRIKDNSLIVYASTPGRYCKVHLKKFELEDCELGIFDTNQLEKLVSIMNGVVIISLEKNKDLITKIKLADNNFDLVYSLADPLVIGKVKWVEDPENWDIELNIEPEEIVHLLKAKTALSEIKNVVLTSTKNIDGDLTSEFVFGEEMGHSNNIKYQKPGIISRDEIYIPLEANHFRDILNSNKDMDLCKLKATASGIVKINFISDEIETEYYIARSE